MDYFEEWQDAQERDDLAAHREAVAEVESKGYGGYAALGPVTRKGDQGLGKYQVMRTNLPSWSEAALGRRVSPAEFLAKPKLQDAIFDHRFGGYLAKHTPADAASMWFTGQPLAVGATRTDRTPTTKGISGAEYVQRYLGNLDKAGAQPAPVTAGPHDEFFNKLYPMTEAAPKESPQAAELFDKLYPAQQPAPAPAMASALPPWGKVENLFSGFVGGLGPRIAAAGQTLKSEFNELQQGASLAEAARHGREFYNPQALAAYQGAQEQFREESPGGALVTDIAGQALPLALGIGATNVVLGAGARAFPAFAPVARTFMGTAGEGMAGLKGFAARRGSDVVAGGLQGAEANALAGENPLTGAEFGAATGGLFGPVGRALSAPSRARMLPKVAEAAEKYTGAKLPVGPMIEGSTGKFVTALAGKGNLEAVEMFNQRLLEHAGADQVAAAHGVKGLTAAVFKDTKSALSAGYDDFAAKAVIPYGIDLETTLRDTAQRAVEDLKKTRPEAARDLVAAVKQIRQSVRNVPSATGVQKQLQGNDLLSIIKPGGVLDNLYKSDNRLTPYATEIKKALLGELEKTSPEGAAALKKLDFNWRSLHELEPLIPVGEHGLISPPRAAQRLRQDASLLGQDARLGEFLSPVNAAGNLTAKVPGMLESVKSHLPAGAGLVGAFAAGQALIENASGLVNAAGANPATALAIGSGFGATAIGKHLYSKWLQSPEYLQQVIDNTLRPQPHWNVNPLTVVAPQVTRDKANPFSFITPLQGQE